MKFETQFSTRFWRQLFQMGGSKKKKKRGGGRRAQSKDHHSTVADYSEILTEEVTALWVPFPVNEHILQILFIYFNHSSKLVCRCVFSVMQ